MRSSIVATATCILACCWSSWLTAGAPSGDATLQALKSGGYVIYLRHALTDTARDDADPIVVKDCSTQRPLSNDGRIQARKIGAAFASIGIAVDRVFSSPYCRAEETAALAFPRAQREALDILWYSLALPKEEALIAAERLKQMLASPPQPGANTVLVGHTSNLKEAVGIWPKKEGEAIVFRPAGNGVFALVGSIAPIEFEKFGS
jgi:phosphohistidine phosphatase SixA